MKFIIAIIGFLLGGAIFFLYTQPTYGSVTELQAQITQYQAALAKAAELDQLRQQLVSRYNSFNPSDLNRLQMLLPDHVDNIGLILELDSLASKHGMALQNIDVSTAPSGATTASNTGGNLSAARAAVGSAQTYASLSLKFSTSGTYGNFLSFLHDLEQSLRIVDLASLSVQPNSSGAGAQKSPSAYQYAITLKTYWLK